MSLSKQNILPCFQYFLKALIGFLFILFFIFDLPSCTHDPFLTEDPPVIDTLPDTIRDTTLINCDTSKTISFQKDIRPLFNICTNCHGPITTNSGIRVDNYIGVKDAIATGRLMGALKWETGFIRMPLDLPQLVGCDIKKIEIWIKNGAINN